MLPKIQVFWKQKIFTPYKIESLIRTAAEYGVAVDVVLQGTRLDAAQISDSSAQISLRQYINTCENVSAVLMSPAIAFQAGAGLHLSSYGLYGDGLMCSPTLRDFFDFAVQYQALATPALQMNWREKDGAAVWLFSDAYGFLITQRTREFLIRQHMAQQITHVKDAGGADCRPIRAFFAFPDAGDKSAYEEFLGCECVFDCRVNELHYPLSLLPRVPRLASGTAHASLREACERLMRQNEAYSGVTGEVYKMLIMASDEFPNMEQIALRMQVTTRTLRRKLEAEGTDYGSILDGVRGHLALEYLQTTKMSTEAIAVKVGFSDGSNFRRAFKRWTGKTTRQMRYSVL